MTTTTTVVAAGVRVDVVVAVYDALDYVRQCLSSLQVHHDGCELRVIVVNDGSGPDTTAWLREAARDWPALRLLEHQDNRGYTRAVNAGLRESDASWVVVLNSDTIVTRGWLTSLLCCAESRPAIGMVGPLSNAASWQSVPHVFDADGQFAVNELTFGMDPHAMADVVSVASQRRYPAVPVLNGFCLLLRRELLERVGLMDDESFPIGYGEENDYCLRATAAGFELAVADDAYVFHAKSKSFGHARRVEHVRSGSAALLAKHGEARVAELSRGVAENHELYAVRDAVKMELGRRSQAAVAQDGPLSVLFLLPVTGASGGASSVILEAAELNRLGARARVVVPEHALGELSAFYAEVPDVRELLLAPSSEQLLELSKDFQVVVATACYTMEWVARIVSANPAILPAYYVQDYEPWFHLDGSPEATAAARSYTRVPGALLFAKTRFLLRTLAERHAISAALVLPSIDHATFRPEPRSERSVLRVTAMVRPQTRRRNAPRTMRVLAELVRRYAGRIEVHVFGCGSRDPRFHELEQDFAFTNHGVLRRAEVADLLRQSDVFVDLSDFQAFGRSAAEAMACGCVAVVPAHGGTDEFAIDGENALVVDAADEAACVERIARLLSDSEQRLRLRAAAPGAVARFSLRGAAQSELELLSAAVRARRDENPPIARRRLVLVRRAALPAGRLALGAVLAGWRTTAVHRSWHIAEQTTLPRPGSADVAVVALRLSGIHWSQLADWLRHWRKAHGRVIVQLELPDGVERGTLARPTRAQMNALSWLVDAADALSVSSAASQRWLREQGIESALLPLGLDPISWRLGPAARGAVRRPEPEKLKLGVLGYALTPELRQVVRQLKASYGNRIAVEVLGGGQRFTRVGKSLRIPRLASESARAAWAFDNLRWDLALFPASRHDGELGAGLLELGALGIPALAVDTDVARACQAAVAMLESSTLRARLAEDARAALAAREDSRGTSGAAGLLDEVVAARLRWQPPELPRGLRSPASASWPPGPERGAIRDGKSAPFPEPRSKVRRKLDKLRRDPTGFLRDSKLGRFRLLKGLFG